MANFQIRLLALKCFQHPTAPQRGKQLQHTSLEISVIESAIKETIPESGCLFIYCFTFHINMNISPSGPTQLDCHLHLRWKSWWHQTLCQCAQTLGWKRKTLIQNMFIDLTVVCNRVHTNMCLQSFRDLQVNDYAVVGCEPCNKRLTYI